MKYELKKFVKVVDELLTYCMLTFDSAKVNVAIEQDASAFRACFSLPDASIAPEQVEALRGKLSADRSPELEDYYWQLAGELEDSHELDLVAKMCDRSEVDAPGGVLTIRLTRKR